MKQKFDSLADMVLFVEVARCGSFSLAAKRLEMPIATVSRRISQMERRLSMKLLVRTTRTVSLAPAAQTYYGHCLQVVEAAEAAHACLGQQDQKSQLIRISMPVDLGVGVLGPLIASQINEFPGLRIELDLSTGVKDLFRDPIDMVLRVGRPLDDRAIARKIWEVNLGIFAAPALLTRYGTPSSPAELADMPCLELITGAGPMPWKVGSMRWNHAPGVVRLAANNMGLMIKLALQGHGVALLPKLLNPQSGGLVELFPADSVQTIPLYAITASRSLSAPLRAIISNLKTGLNGLKQ